MNPASGSQASASSGLDAPEEAASPEEQAMYDQVVNQALDTITPEGQDQPQPAIVAQLRGEFPPQVQELFANAEPPIDGNPLDAAAVTACMLVAMTERRIEAQTKTQIPNDVMYHAGAEVVEYVANLSDALGLHDFSEEDIERVFYRALDLYRTISPRADQDALSGEFEQIIAADQQGQLGALLPGVEGAARQGAQ